LAAQTRQNRCLQDAGNISKLSRELTNFHDVYTHPQQSMPVSVGRAMQMLQIGTASSAQLVIHLRLQPFLEGVCRGCGGEPRARGLHSSTFLAQREHFLWDTLGTISR
jgi:hypothetical protein